MSEQVKVRFAFSLFCLFRRFVTSRVRCFCDLAGISYEITEHKSLLNSYYIVSITGNKEAIEQFKKFITRLKWCFN
jgi:hypothetical protein